MGLFGDLLGGAAKIVGIVVGTVIGVAAAVVAETLGITVTMVEEAKKAGCKTYEEIREFWNLD